MQSIYSAHLIVSILLGFLINSCDKVDTKDTSDQPVYFEYSYNNMAWGYQFHGWLIDKHGNVNYYNMPGNWKYGEEDGISYIDLIFNLTQTDSVIAIIDSDILKEKTQLINQAKKGEVTPLTQRANDAGTSVLKAYYYDQEEKMYKSVFLAQSGDFESYNMDSAAISLTNWLKQFNVFWLD